MTDTGSPGPSLHLVRYGTEDYLSCVELRNAVLRRPLGMSLSEEQIRGEADDVHLGCRIGDRWVGCAVLTPLTPRRVRLRQMAVDPAWRSRGIGGALLRYAEQQARARGFAECILHARGNAVPFYLDAGYQLRGGPFIEVSLPHRLMSKRL